MSPGAPRLAFEIWDQTIIWVVYENFASQPNARIPPLTSFGWSHPVGRSCRMG